MLACRDEQERRPPARRMHVDGRVGGPAHGLHARVKVVDVKALDVDLQRHRPHARREVEQPVRAGADPLAHVLCVGDGVAERDDADRALQLCTHVAHARRHHLHHRALWPAQQVHLVHQQQRHALHSLALPPAPREHVPALGRRHHDVGLVQDLGVHQAFARQLRHRQPEALAKLLAPVCEPLLHERLQRRYVHAACRAVAVSRARQHAKHRKLCADGLAAARRRAHQR
mmetsp:Transcript_23096/g.68644  ORF Transcript_23096/g.68644 Transcript_23096/m.68644 type:complete len:229 (+) Transcript_23096:2044-2730(+)